MKIYGIVGWKNSGKTTLVERLVVEITRRGFSVSTVKHAHHTFDVDHEGKDSHRHRSAGAHEVLLVSRNRWALMHENRGEAEPSLPELLGKLAAVDLVLIEGYKRDGHPKVEAHQSHGTQDMLALNDPTIRAVAAGCDVGNLSVPVFSIDDIETIADFILQEVDLVPDTQTGK